MEEHKLSRRIFLKSSGGAAAVVGTVGAALLPSEAQAASPAGSTSTNLNYPKRSVGKAGGMPVNQAVSFSYPDASSPCVALRMGSAVPGGVGPNNDIVAYSTLCTHMGCPVQYDGGTKRLQVPLPLQRCSTPRTTGRWCAVRPPRTCRACCSTTTTKTDTVTAVGVDGLIYGRQANIL